MWKKGGMDTSLLEKYQIVKQLGCGGSSTVFLAKHQQLHTLRVIKQRQKNTLLNQHSLSESIILSKLHHSRIPIMYDWEEDDQYYYLIMEYCDGISLKSFMLKEQTILEQNILNYTLQICETIKYMHNQEEPVLYLDFNPDNLIVLENQIKLVDFSNAMYKSSSQTRIASAGTLGYAAPEQYVGGVLDERTDIYGIGMIMYFMVVGKVLDRDHNHIKNVEQYHRCSKQLSKIINRCIKENPSARYQEVEQLIMALSKLCEEKKHKDRNHVNTSLKIAIAGSKCTQGTTYIALILAKYLSHYNKRALYVEKNQSDYIKDIINYKGDFLYQDGVYRGKLIEMLPNAMEEIIEYSDNYPFMIQDYGVLTATNQDQFLEADLRLLVTMQKPWEVNNDFLERMEVAGKQHKSVSILVNMASPHEYEELVEYYSVPNLVKNVYRVPYIGDLLGRRFETYVWEWIRTMLLELVDKKE